MKKYFFTGLVILLPLALTVFIISFVFNTLTDPFVEIVQNVLQRFGFFSSRMAIDAQIIISKIIILIFLFVFNVLLGMLTSWFLIRFLLNFWDSILHRIPFVRSIYKVSQDVIHTLFVGEGKSFKQVVLVPFPHTSCRSIGFIAREEFSPLQNPSEDLVTVFIPTAPNPTSGFLIAVSNKEIIRLEMKVEDAFKYIVSCGVIVTPPPSPSAPPEIIP